MNQATSEQEAHPDRDAGDSRWVSRTLLVTFCVGLVGLLGIVFTRVVAARVPAQRATLERLIAERTGLEVRFDNVHFAWDLGGTSAVFEHVELDDPKNGRVHVVAPELRVEFDSWAFLRRQEFTLGHVTVRSPDIEIIADAEEPLLKPVRALASNAAADEDEDAFVRQYTAWAELMPIGRVEVEGARVHLVRRGAAAADGNSRRSFTLSQAVVNRGASTLTAYGTLLLAQDVGQSLFVSAKLENLGPKSQIDGELRLIARRVFLDKVAATLHGRGTLDARLKLLDGRVESGAWTANARELEIADGSAAFDHVSMNGTLARERSDLIVDVTDLQLTRGSRLERAPRIATRIAFQPGSLRLARASFEADRLPFMSAELIASVLESRVRLPPLPAGWTPSAGELHAVRVTLDGRHAAAEGWTASAELREAELTRREDGSRLAQVFAQLDGNSRRLSVTFDARHPVALHLAAGFEPRLITFDGGIAREASGGWRFDGLSLRSGDGVIAARGEWNAARPRALDVDLQDVDRALVADLWACIATPADATPEPLAQLAGATLVAGSLHILPGDAGVDWRRSNGKVQLAALTSATASPQLRDAHGTLAFAHGSATLLLDAGAVDDLQLEQARLEWPRDGEPRARVSLAGSLASPVFRGTLAAQGLDRLTGNVTLDADVRGARQLRDPASWPVTARVSDAKVPLTDNLPAIERLAGTLRWSDGQLRTLDLSGQWFGGAVSLDAKRAIPGAKPVLTASGTADAAKLLRAVGQEALAARVSGTLAWTGNAQLLAQDSWQLSFASNLGGLESRLPPPFAKARGRTAQLDARLRVDTTGIREFSVSARELDVRGSSREGAIDAHFEVQGVDGSFTRAGWNATPRLAFERLDLARTPATLAAAGAVLPIDGELSVAIDDVRSGEQAFGALSAMLVRRESGLHFDVESAASAPHHIALQGLCSPERRCEAAFSADSSQLAALVRDVKLPAEWPAQSLHAEGNLAWPADAAADGRSVSGRFDVATRGADPGHTLVASATLADGQIDLSNVEGTGPASDQVFRGNGRVGLLTRDYDLTVDYEQVSLAATAVPSSTRARLARAWSVLRGSAVKRGWAEAAESRRVQWHGYWE